MSPKQSSCDVGQVPSDMRQLSMTHVLDVKQFDQVVNSCTCTTIDATWTKYFAHFHEHITKQLQVSSNHTFKDKFECISQDLATFAFNFTNACVASNLIS